MIRDAAIRRIAGRAGVEPRIVELTCYSLEEVTGRARTKASGTRVPSKHLE